MTKLKIGVVIGFLISILIGSLITGPVVGELSETIIKITFSSIPTFDNAGAQLLLYGIVVIIYYLSQIPFWIWALLFLVTVIIAVIFT